MKKLILESVKVSWIGSKKLLLYAIKILRHHIGIQAKFIIGSQK